MPPHEPSRTIVGPGLCPGDVMPTSTGETDSSAADLMVIFGITDDLAHKMTFRALDRLERWRLLDCPIVGVAHDDLSVERLRNTPTMHADSRDSRP